MCCLLPVLKRMGFHTRAWQYSISPTLPFLSLSCRNTRIFWGSGWEHFPFMKVSAHKKNDQKLLCPLQFVDLYCIFTASLLGKIRCLWQCFWHLPPQSSPRHVSLRGISWAMFFWSGTGVYVLSWRKMCMKEMEEIFQKYQRCVMHSGKQLAGRTCSRGSPYHKPSWSIHTSFLL